MEFGHSGIESLSRRGGAQQSEDRKGQSRFLDAGGGRKATSRNGLDATSEALPPQTLDCPALVTWIKHGEPVQTQLLSRV